MSIAILYLVDHGEIDVHAPVAKCWPGFGQNGKEKGAVQHLLSQTSAVWAWPAAAATGALLHRFWR